MTDQNDLQNVLELVSFRNVVFTCSVVESIRCMVQLLSCHPSLFLGKIAQVYSLQTFWKFVVKSLSSYTEADSIHQNHYIDSYCTVQYDNGILPIHQLCTCILYAHAGGSNRTAPEACISHSCDVPHAHLGTGSEKRQT